MCKARLASFWPCLLCGLHLVPAPLCTPLCSLCFFMGPSMLSCCAQSGLAAVSSCVGLQASSASVPCPGEESATPVLDKLWPLSCQMEGQLLRWSSWMESGCHGDLAEVFLSLCSAETSCSLLWCVPPGRRDTFNWEELECLCCCH